MTSDQKKVLKAWIIRWELWWYGATAMIYLAAVPVTALLFPNVSNLWLSIFILVSGFTAAMGSIASAIKTDDTTK